MTTPVPLRLDLIQGWLGAAVDGVTRRVPLRGGRTAPVVERVSFALAGSDDEIDVLAKRATPGEVAALRCLRIVEPSFPELIDFGTDDDGPWVVVSYQPGQSIGWMTEPPPMVYAALARLHRCHLGRTDELPPEIPRVDVGFLREAFARFAPSGIATAARQAARPVHDRALELLARFVDDERLLLGLEVLPATLLHGDVHGDNVIAPAQLIDWGSARVGPGMLDVVMAAGPAGVAAYRGGWGAELDDWQAVTGEAWGTAVSNAMFVGAVAERSAATAVVMVDEAERAIERLGRQLSRRI